MKLLQLGLCRSPARIAALTLSLVCAASLSATPWTVVRLNPTGANASYGFAAGNGSQGGQVYSGGVYRAALWHGSAASYIDLNPAGAGRSEIRSIFGNQQAGQAIVGGGWRAGIWSGTAASWLNLNPAAATWSAAYGTDGTQQVGTATIGGAQHAGLWTGTAASWVDIHPLGATLSYGYTNGGGWQGGWVQFGGNDHAALWHGTAGSFLDLNPAVSTRSRVNSIWDAWQAGFVTISGVQQACMWNQTRDSWTSIHPAGATYSEALGMYGPRQVGHAVLSGIPHAILWNSKADGYVDLNAFLPAHLNSASAASVWDDGTHIYVVGYGWHSVNATPYEALLWIGDVEIHLAGTVHFGDLISQARQPNPVVLEFREPGTMNVVDTEVVNLSEAGDFDVVLRHALPLDISIKAGTWLRRTVAVTAGPIEFNLVNGDCDGDNEVAIGDYAILSAAYNTAPGDPDWSAMGDLNRDDAVDIGDYAILSARYGLFGDE